VNGLDFLMHDYVQIPITKLGEFFGVKVITVGGLALPRMLPVCRRCGEDADTDHDLTTGEMTTYCRKCRIFITLTRDEIEVLVGGS